MKGLGQKIEEPTLLSPETELTAKKFWAAPRGAAFFFILLVISCLGGCASPVEDIVATRPKQLMSDAEVAVQAAEEASAETLAPAFFRRARDHYLEARQAYRKKNFGQARRHAESAIQFAERAEFEALKASDSAQKPF